MVVVAVAEYETRCPQSDLEFKKDIEAQVEEVKRWWASPELDDSRRFSLEQPASVKTARDLREFLGKLELDEALPSDVLVIYITGHGVNPGSDQHFLLLTESLHDRTLSTAFRTAGLIATALDSEAEHVLVIVDSCYSGVLSAELHTTLKALSAPRQGSPSLVVLTTGNAESKPRPRDFTNMLEGMRKLCGDESQGLVGSHLSYKDFLKLAEKSSPTGGLNLHMVWPTSNLEVEKEHAEPSPCLPNPGYVPSLKRSSGGLDQAWWVQASGAPQSENFEKDAWFFSGRIDLLRRIAWFLRAGRGSLIVTGRTGSGKSTLLAHHVVLADADFRKNPRVAALIKVMPEDLRVDQGAVTVALNARARSAEELAEVLCASLPEDGSGPRMPDTRATRHLVEEVARRSGRGNGLITMVIDGIDESTDPDRVITDLIRPLAELRTIEGGLSVRLLLSVRSIINDLGKSSGLLQALTRATGAEVLSTDKDLVSAKDDIEDYVLSLLQNRFGVSSRSSQLGDLARAIAQEVTPSFLDARFAAERLGRKRLRSHLQDPSDRAWRQELRQGTENVLRRDLNDVVVETGIPLHYLVAILRCTAFAQGEGLPWEKVWPTVLQKLLLDEITVDRASELIDKVLQGRLAGYLLSAEEDGRRVYRPMHERLGELLRTGFPDFPTDPILVHNGFAKALHLLWESEGASAHPYALRHLVVHAALGGVLSDAVVPASFLPYEKGGKVRASLGLLAEHTKNATGLSVWARIEPWLADASADARADSFALAAHGLVRNPVTPHSLFPLWTDTAVRNNSLVDRKQGAIGPVISCRTQGQEPRVAVGDVDGRVRIWDITSGMTVGRPIEGPWGAPVTALTALTDADDRSWLAVGGEKGAWLYCLDTRDDEVPETVPVPESARRYVQAILVVPGTEETERLEIATATGLVFHHPWWDASEDPPPLDGEDGPPIGPLALLDTGEQRLMAVTLPDRVELHDADSRQTISTIPEPNHRITALVLYLGQDGSPMLVTGECSEDRSEGVVRVRYALSGDERTFPPLRLPVTAVTRYDHSGRGTLIGLGGPDGSVRLWNPNTGEEYRRFPVDHIKKVTGLAVVSGRDGVSMLVSGSSDGSVRLWNPEAGERTWRRPFGTGDRLVPLPQSSRKGQLLVLEPHGFLGVMSAATGERSPNRVEPPVRNVRGSVTALAAHPSPGGEPIVVAGLRDGTVALRKGAGGPGAGPWTMTDIACPADHATAFAFFEDANGKTMLAAGMSNGGVLYCDPSSGDIRGRSLGGVGAPVRGLAVLRTPETLLAIASGDGVRLCRPFQEPYLHAPDGAGAIRSLAVSSGNGPDGKDHLIIGNENGDIRCWSPGNPDSSPVLFRGHRGPVSALAVLPPEVNMGRSSLLISAGARDTTVRVWDTLRRREVKRLVTGMSLTSLCALGVGEVPGVDAPFIVFGGPDGSAGVISAIDR
jgi:WD40 repeat protein